MDNKTAGSDVRLKILFCGLDGAGKSTLGNTLKVAPHRFLSGSSLGRHEKHERKYETDFFTNFTNPNFIRARKARGYAKE